jgi:hypothetical protein
MAQTRIDRLAIGDNIRRIFLQIATSQGFGVVDAENLLGIEGLFVLGFEC